MRPLSAFGKSDYVALLRTMAAPELALIEQAPDGTIMLGSQGERLTAGRDFYAIFATDQEWKLVAGGRTLGTIPISTPVGIGGIVSFAGQRWKIVAVDDPAKVLEIVRHASGKIPKFDSLINEPIHDRLASMMRVTLVSNDVPAYLDAQAAEYLFSARDAFQELGLQQASLIAAGKDTHVLTWLGTEINSVLAFAITSAGLECAVLDIGITVLDTQPDIVSEFLRQIADAPPSIDDIAEFVENLQTEKFDAFIPEPMLRQLWARAHLQDATRIAGIAGRLAG